MADTLEFLLVPIAISPSTPPAFYSLPASSSPSPPASPRRRVKRSTPTEPPSPDDSPRLTSVPDDHVAVSTGGSPRPQASPATQAYAVFSSTGRSRSSSSPRRGSFKDRIVPVGIPLVADVQLSKSRIIVTRKLCLYNDPNLDYPSAMLGFNVTVHTPPSTSARVKYTQLTLNFLGLPGRATPIIKGIAPAASALGEATTVEEEQGLTVGMTVGYDPFAHISLTSTSSRKFTHSTQATLLTSNVETSEAWITLDEDPTTRAGVPSSFDFAVLLQRSEEAEGFEVELSLEASVGRGVEESWQRFLGSPRAWRLVYDGQTETKAAVRGGVMVR